MVATMPPWFSSARIDAVLAGMVAAPPGSPRRSVPAPSPRCRPCPRCRRRCAWSCRPAGRRARPTCLTVGELLLELGGVGGAEVVADGGAADVEAEAGTLALEVGEVFRRGLGEVVGGQLDGVEAQVRGQVDEVVAASSAASAWLQVEVLAVAVGGDAEAQVRSCRCAGSARWRRAGWTASAPVAAGGDAGAEELAARGWGHRRNLAGEVAARRTPPD